MNPGVSAGLDTRPDDLALDALIPPHRTPTLPFVGRGPYLLWALCERSGECFCLSAIHTLIAIRMFRRGGGGGGVGK